MFHVKNPTNAWNVLKIDSCYTCIYHILVVLTVWFGYSHVYPTPISMLCLPQPCWDGQGKWEVCLCQLLADLPVWSRGQVHMSPIFVPLCNPMHKKSGFRKPGCDTLINLEFLRCGNSCYMHCNPELLPVFIKLLRSSPWNIHLHHGYD